MKHDTDTPTYGREIPVTDHGVISRKRAKKCCCLSSTAIIVFALVVIGIWGATYYRAQLRKNDIKELHTYMKGLVDAVNTDPKSRWKAKFNPFGMKNKDYNYKTLKNVTAVKEYVKHLEDSFGSDKMKKHLHEIESFPLTQLPRRFDAREKWPLCPSLHYVPNQGGCGSCFAVSSMTVASDRACIHSNATFRSLLSVEDVLGCCKACGNCLTGGDPLKAFTYWVLEGVVTGNKDGCRPYTQSKECGTPCMPDEYPAGEQKRQCLKQCQPSYYKKNYVDDKHFGGLAYTLYPRKMTVDQGGKEKVLMSSVIGHFNKTSAKPLTSDEIHDIIKKELYLFGPTTMAFPVTEEFLHYESGIFHPVPEEAFDKRIIYWHVVRLIGWGRDEKDQLFWTAINSFGSQWGDNGLFHVDTKLFEKYGLEYETGLPL